MPFLPFVTRKKNHNFRWDQFLRFYTIYHLSAVNCIRSMTTHVLSSVIQDIQGHSRPLSKRFSKHNKRLSRIIQAAILRYHGTPKLTMFSKNTLLPFSDRYYSNLSFTKSFRKKDCFYAKLWTKKDLWH